MPEYPSRIFQGFNPAGPACPVCGTKADLETVLVPIPGTEKEHLVECRQVHVECFNHKRRMELHREAD